MSINAYSSFVQLPPTELLARFKHEFRTIPATMRQCSLNQAYQHLAKAVGFNCLEAMRAQDSALLTVNEFVKTLESSGMIRDSWLTNVRYAQLLQCDVLCMYSNGNLCVAIRDDNEIIETPYYTNPVPYSPHITFYVLPVNSEGAWLTYDEWYSFILDLRGNLNFDDDINSQIEDIWSLVSPNTCGELFLSEQPDYNEIAHCSEGQLRQRVLEHSGHTPLELLYEYFSQERTKLLPCNKQ